MMIQGPLLGVKNIAAGSNNEGLMALANRVTHKTSPAELVQISAQEKKLTQQKIVQEHGQKASELHFNSVIDMTQQHFAKQRKRIQNGWIFA
ncbi:MAG: hypothetical protein VKJ06_00545 [Vampirovibrionales bacterium]|nr:hypothetical protein [Vampirovibrionales bacterium]